MSAVVTAAVPLVTDERLAHIAPWLPLVIAALLLLAAIWTDRGVPWVTEEDGDGTVAPPSARETRSREALGRASDRG